MKKNRFRIFLILAFIALAVYFLYPTWTDSQYQKELKSKHGADSAKYYDKNENAIRNARANRIKLGLDLQGGMYVTLEVNIGEMLEKIAKNKDEKLRQIIAATKAEALTSDEPILNIFQRNFDKEGMRLSRYYGDIRNSNAEVMKTLHDESEKAIDRALEIIRNRIDQYGVSEVAIQRSGNRRIILELPGVSDEKEVRGLIQETAQLEFKLFADPKLAVRALENIDQILIGKNITDVLDTSSTRKDSLKAAAKADSAKSAGLSKDQQLAKFQKEHPFQSLFIPTQYGLYAEASQKDRINNILKRPDVQKVIPDELKFAWSAKSHAMFKDNSKQYFEFYYLKADPELTGSVITNARGQMTQQGFGGAVVSMEMNAEGAREWARITGANVDKQIAIVLDNAVFSAPRVKQKIIGGNSQIDGMAGMEEARLLEIVLKAGALPAPVEIIEERTVGPSLGEDSIQKGMTAFYVGVGFVILFMLFYYLSGGLPADIAMIFNILLLLGILAAFHATLTLPGLAGMLLTVGLSVDANVLVNERVREEFGMGKTLRAAIDAGYQRALPSIIDSNMTTLITCIILYQFGTGPVQGFALTLMIGIVCSLFTAVIMTHVMFDAALESKPSVIRFG